MIYLKRRCILTVNKLKKHISEYFVGQEDIIENVMICLFSGGHILLEGVPGVGKTTLASTLARSVDCDFGRIQFTPDTLPTDVMGSEVFNMKTGEFEYREGAIMHQIVLADEINRTSPKTQSSLLEAMAEGQTTVSGVKHKLPEPFMVIATQNPVEFMGTYQLPEAQLDRFMMKLTIGYPDEKEELRMTQNMLSGKTAETVRSVITAQDVIEIRKKVADVTIKDEVIRYARNIADMTRNEKRFVLGASPRAVLALVKASQAKAFLDGRDFVKPDDIKAVAPRVLGHRLTLTSEARIAKENKKAIINYLIQHTKIPL
ncbi:MAG: AAA family ATPase [Oscillospiraceae bacterium]